MQLYALDPQGSPCYVKQADRTLIYTCPECKLPLRIRGGPSKQLHFYHPALSSPCRQKEKSPEHIQTQLYLFGQLASSQMEAPLLNRIADIFDPVRKLVIEVQCSPITVQEAQMRISDYEKMGYQILWILHDKRFNKQRLSSSELFLRSCGAYYTNIDKDGKGILYDQFEILHQGHRLFKGPKLPLTTLDPLPLPSIRAALPHLFKQRLSCWKICLAGDLITRFSEENLSSFLHLESSFLKKKQRGALPVFALLHRLYRHLLSLLIKTT